MNAVVRKAGLADIILCDSAGTMDWHTGKLPDARMRQAAKEHGYDFRCRQASADNRLGGI